MGAVLPWGLGQGPECPVGPPGPWTAALTHAQVCMVSPSDICLCLGSPTAPAFSGPARAGSPVCIMAWLLFRQDWGCNIMKSQHLSRLDLQIIGDPGEMGQVKATHL